MENEQEPCKQLYEKRLNAFYEPLPQAVEEVRGVFSKFDLTHEAGSLCDSLRSESDDKR